jgi:hypothetical protein
MATDLYLGLRCIQTTALYVFTTQDHLILDSAMRLILHYRETSGLSLLDRYFVVSREYLTPAK